MPTTGKQLLRIWMKKMIPLLKDVCPQKNNNGSSERRASNSDDDDDDEPPDRRIAKVERRFESVLKFKPQSPPWWEGWEEIGSNMEAGKQPATSTSITLTLKREIPQSPS